MGKKYVEPFEMNPDWMSLEWILNKVCVQREDSYLFELYHNVEVWKRIKMMTNQCGWAKKGYLISYDVIWGITLEETLMITWYEWDMDKVDFDGPNRDPNLSPIENAYLAYISKFVPLRVKNQLKKERPNRPLTSKPKKPKYKESIVDQYYREHHAEEYGYDLDAKEEVEEKLEKYKNTDESYKYYEVLSGDSNDLALLSDQLQESRWNSNYGRDIEECNNNLGFKELIESLTENQQKIISGIFKEQYTESELGQLQDKPVSQQAIHRTKMRAIKRIKKQLEEVNR